MAKQTDRSDQTKLALVRATLKIAAQEGVKNVTHRKIAAAARVSLGTTSYHFESLDTLLLEAFGYYVNNVRMRYETQLTAAKTPEQLADAIMTFVDVHHSEGYDAILMYELYAHAVRDRSYATLVQRWSRSTKEAFERLYSAEMAIKLESILEGMVFQRLFGGSLSDRQLRRFLLETMATEVARVPDKQIQSV